VSALILLALAPLGRAWAQEQPANPFAATWANLAGATVFRQKGCDVCHAIRGFGPTAGPELARIDRKSFFDVGAAMSNHLRGVNIKRVPLTPDEVAALISFIFTLQYYDEPGDPQRGERLFTSKACVQCHEVAGQGGRSGPSLDFLKRANSPVLIAAALWNHGPEMAEVLKAKGIARPTFGRKDLSDIIAYIQTAAREGGEPRGITPGTPEQGAKLFAEKRCATCHAIGDKGGRVGPTLGRQHHVSLTQFASLMWDHAPAMWGRMKERGIQIPRISGQEMADIVAFLYASHYFDEPGNLARGRQLVQSRDCLNCHPVSGRGPKDGPDFAGSKASATAAGLVAAMWNHTRYIEAQKTEVPWPILTGQELADIGAYLASLSRLPPPKKP
jgi:mono/diheme cytochrome c family protein